MKKEIDQRSKNKLLIGCNCGGYHYLSLSYEKDEEWGNDFYIAIIDVPSNLWDRVKQAFNHVFKGGDLWASEIGLTSENLKDIKKIINKYLTE